jgi:hypothetical protein
MPADEKAIPARSAGAGAAGRWTAAPGLDSALNGCYQLAGDLGHLISLWDQPSVSCACGVRFGGPGQVADLAHINAHLVAVTAAALQERGELTADGRVVLVRIAAEFTGTFAELLRTAQAVSDPPA